MQDPVWQGADAAVFYENMVRSQVTSRPLEEPLVALPLKLRSHLQAPAVLKTSSETQTHPDSAKPVSSESHLPSSFFFHPETLFADPLPLLHSVCQRSNPCAYCRLPRGCISAWCKYTSWPDKSTTIISECLLWHPVTRGERSGAVLKIPLLYDNISCFHPSRIQAAICYLQDFPCQHN